MAFRGRLCRTCSGFGFDKDHPPFGQYRERSIFGTNAILKLGLLKEVRERTCPLCKLVSFATLEIQRTETFSLDDGDEVGLWWLPYPGEGGVFSLWYASKGISKGTFLSFVRSKSDLPSERPASLFLPLPKSQVNFSRVRRWLDECESTHSPMCFHPPHQGASVQATFPGLKVLRLIDTHRHCLVELEAPCRYVTLSYVWGVVPSLRLSTANKHRLMQPGAIQQAWSLVPKTIQDAITMTSLVAERYLWVDSLCLVQNDPDDLQRGTRVMDLIYELSVLCIVAAGGKDANAGLLGVRSGSRKTSEVMAEVEPGLKLAVFTDADYHLADTVYSSRAWTLQEQALSRRLIYFVNNQVYFRCRRRAYSESMIDWQNSPVEDLVWGAIFKAMGMGQPMENLASIIELYSQRALTYQSDISRAFAGITRRFETRMQTSFFQGLPIHCIDRFLLFYGSHTSLRRRKDFPSYSWVGWIGPLKFSPTYEVFSGRPIEEDKWLETCRWIVWYKSSASGTERILTSRNSDPVYHDLSKRQPFSFYYQYHLPFATSRIRPSKYAESPSFQYPSYPILQFWTMSAFFRLSEIDVLRGSACMMDQDNMLCGELFMDGYDESTFYIDRSVFEFIILSVPRSKRPATKKFISGTWIFFVMCIETHNGLSERRGIGWIVLEALHTSLEPGLAWKEIFLS